MSGEGPCGPLSQQGTGVPDNSASGFCGTVGPAVFDWFFYQGDDIRRTVTYESPPGTGVDLTGAAIEMDIRKGPAVLHPDPALIALAVGTGITITDAVNGVFQFLVTAAQSALLSGSTPFFYDIQVTPVGGDKVTILRGRIFFDLQVTNV